MRKILFKNARVIDEGSAFHLQQKDVLIHNGKIEKIGENISDSDATVVSSPQLHLSAGWVDLGVQYGDPGYEHRETLKTGLNASLYGGFSEVLLLPNLHPTTDNKAALNYLLERSKDHPVTLHPCGCLTEANEGKEMSELFDLSENGAVAFADGLIPIENPDLLKRLLLYLKTQSTPVFLSPFDKKLGGAGIINESENTVSLGLKTLPHITETIRIKRDLEISQYAEKPIHFMGISSHESVSILKEAQEKNISFSASVSVNNLIHTDEDLSNFDTHLKLLPPLRERQSVDALKEALTKGIITVIYSQHQPLEPEQKFCEFDHAGFGSIGTQTLFSLLCSDKINPLPLTVIIKAITQGPRRVLNMENPVIQEGVEANITAFDPEIKWNFNAVTNKSLSKNSIHFNKELTGRALAVCSKGSINLL